MSLAVWIAVGAAVLTVGLVLLACLDWRSDKRSRDARRNKQAAQRERFAQNAASEPAPTDRNGSAPRQSFGRR